MNVGIMQPYFFPYIGYWQLIYAVDKYVVFDDVNYIKRGWINKNYILYNNQRKQINVYLKGVSQNKLINEVEIGDRDNNLNNLTVIQDAYRKAPYFEQVFPIIEKIICQDATNVAEYNEFLLKAIIKYLGISTEIYRSSDLNKDNSLRGQDKIIDICKVLGADAYYNAIGGTELYHIDAFRNNNMELFFLNPGAVNYKQFGDVFVSDLSIIDVLMFNSIMDIRGLLENYELVKGGSI